MDATPFAVAQGNPDWQGIVTGEHADLLPAYGNTRVHFALPKSVRMAARQDGSPDFFLEFFSDEQDPAADNSLYAMLEMGLDIDPGFAAAGAAVLPITFATGNWCHLELGDTHASLPFAWEGNGRATINARLSLDSARLLYAALASSGAIILRAAVECEVAAVLPRHELRVRFNARTLLPALTAALDGGGQGMPFDSLVHYLDRPAPGLFAVEGGAGQECGLALAGRLLQAFGQFAPCTRVNDGPRIRLTAPAALASETEWDLRTPVLCGVPVFLRYDPFSSLVGSQARDKVTAFHRVPALPNQLRTRHITVASGLPHAFSNCSEISVTLRVEKGDALSGTTTTQTVVLYPAASRSTTVELAYAKINGPKPYRAKVRIVSETDVTESDWFDATDDYLFIDRARLPLPCLILRATAALLAQATLTATLPGGAGAAPVTTTLDKAAPVMAIVLPASAPQDRLQILARSLADPGRTVSLELPCQSVELDTALFQQYGEQTAEVHVNFHDNTDQAELEFEAASGDTARAVLDFSDLQPHNRFNYVASDMFNNGYRFRQYGGDDASPFPWSPFLAPDQALLLGMYRSGPRQETGPINQDNQHD